MKMKRKNAIYCLLTAGCAALLGACSKTEEKRDDGARDGEGPGKERPAAVVESSAEIRKRVDWEQEVDNPKTDGWESEVLAAEAKKQLKELGKILTDRNSPDSAAVAALVADSFSGEALVPRLETVFEDALTTVERPPKRGEAKPSVQGAEGFRAALEATEFRSEGTKDHRSEFKVVKVSPGEGGFATDQLVSLSWNTGEAIVEQHATWTTDWQSGGDGEAPPKLRTLRVTRFEQTRTKLAGGGPMFADCTESVLGANRSYREQLLYGLNHWHERMPYLSTLNGMSTPGLAVGDVNGDGLDDLYLCQDPRLPNRLFLQNPNGTLRDVSKEWGVDWLEDSRCALLVDLDNDGDRDLAVAILGHVLVASNRDRQRFELELVIPVSESATSLTGADYDRDGRIDLYVCAYAPETAGAVAAPGAGGLGSERFSFHDANNAVPNTLLRNETAAPGEWKFTDVTKAVGLDVNNRRWSFAAGWEDYDNDGDPDLYVANDYGRNNLYRNDRGEDGGVRFVDVAGELGGEDSASGMSVSWGDYDRDGRMDLYVSNMFSAAGSRIVALPQFKPKISGDLRQRYQHFARGNTLLRNLGEEGFGDTSVAAGVTLGRWAWSSNFVDLNNDGWEDLVVANGNITAEDDSGDL